MKITKDKYHGVKVLEESVYNVGPSTLLRGYLEGYYADTEPWVGLSTSGRINLNPRTWESLKEQVERMFEAVKEKRGMEWK